MSRRDASALVVGGEPRIDFLPPEVKARKQLKSTRRLLIVLVLLVLVVCGAGYALSAGLAMRSHELLEAEQTNTQKLLEKQLEFVDTRTTVQSLALGEDARLVASSTEILWREYLAEVQGTLPGGVVISTFSITSLSATDARPELGIPLQEPRVATLSFTAISSEFGTLEQLLVNLRTLPGFADATVKSVLLDDNGYAATLEVNINSDAFEGRFATAPESDGAGTTTPDSAEEVVSDASAPDGEE